ncbi:MAG: hypothetical protein OSB00_07720 [Sphingomonas bacterium]|nr:hypothetical protein [Sphingomonas bacterium]
MEDDRAERFVFGELRLRAGQSFATGIDCHLDLGIRGAAGQRVDQPGDLSPQFLDAATGVVQAARHRLALAGTLLVVAFDDGGNDLGREQRLLQRGERAILERFSPDPAHVVARPRFAVAAASPAILGHDRVCPAAGATTHEAGQDVLRPGLPVEGQVRARLAALLDRLPQRFVDDAQILRDGLGAIGGVVDARDAASAGRIADHADAVVDDPAGVGGVVEDAVGAPGRAGDRAGVPFAPAWCRGALGVQRLRDRFRAAIVSIIGEDAADDVGLGGDDAAVAALDRAVGQQQRRGFVAVTEPARHPAAGDDAALTTSDLVAEFLHEQRVHRAREPDVHQVDALFGHSEQLHLGEFEALEDRRGVGEVARDAIERLGDHDVERSRLRPRQQRVQPGAIVVGAGDREVGEGVDDLPPFAVSVFPADPDLVLGAADVLQFRAEPRVDGGAKARACRWREHDLLLWPIRRQHLRSPCRWQWHARGRRCRASRGALRDPGVGQAFEVGGADDASDAANRVLPPRKRLVQIGEFGGGPFVRVCAGDLAGTRGGGAGLVCVASGLLLIFGNQPPVMFATGEPAKHKSAPLRAFGAV